MIGRFNIYLCIFDDAREPSYQICSSVREAMTVWSTTKPTSTALLHIGQSRPMLEELIELVAPYRGKVLIAETARWHLPKECQESSDSVFDLPLSDIWRAVPVRLSLSGWGYDMYDPNPSSQIDEDESSSVVEEDIRNITDPFELLKLAPIWFYYVHFSELDLSARVAHVLKAERLELVGELLQLSIDDLLGWHNFGKKSIGDLANSIKTGMLNPRTKWKAYRPSSADRFLTEKEATGLLDDLNEIQEQPSFLAAFTEWMDTEIKEKQVTMFQMRLGMVSTTYKFQEIGDIFDLTRERVRQITHRCSKRFKETDLFDTTLARLSDLIKSSEKPVYLDFISTRDPWLDFPRRDGSVLPRLFDLFKPEIQLCEFQNRTVITRCRIPTYDQLVSAVKSEVTGSSMTLKALKEQVNSVCLGLKATEFSEAIAQEILSGSIVVLDEHGTEIVEDFNLSVQSAVRSTLQNSSIPLALGVIESRVETLLNRTISSEYIRRECREGAFLYGPSTYGTSDHLRFTESKILKIRDLIQKSVSEGDPIKQWHNRDLAQLIEEQFPDWRYLPDMYEIGVILHNNSNLKYLGYHVWTSASGLDERIQIMDAAEAILIAEKKPLKEKKLLEMIDKFRGLGKQKYLYPTNSVSRLTAGLWGLVERDFNLDISEIVSLMDECESRVYQSGGRGIAIVEMWSDTRRPSSKQAGDLLIEGLDLLKGLLSSDPRFQLNIDGLIKLDTDA